MVQVLNEFSATQTMIIAGVFFIAGLVKGLVGIGFPTIILGLLTTVIGLNAAISLMLLPSLVTNLMQASMGGHAKRLTQTFSTLFISAMGAVLLGCWVALYLDTTFLSTFLGIIVLLYGVSGLLNFKLTLANNHSRLIPTIIGVLNGMITGLTGTFAIPGIFYLQAMQLNKNELVQAMGLLFTISTAALMLGMALVGELNISASVLSLLALMPAMLGMWLGIKVRHGLSNHHFTNLLYVSFCMLGAYIMWSYY